MTKATKLIKKQEEQVTSELATRDKVLIPNTKAIIKLINDYEYILEDTANDQQLRDKYSDLAKQILEYARDNNMTRSDLVRVLNKITRILSMVFDTLIQTSLNRTSEVIENKVFGHLMEDMTLKELDDILKK